MAQEFHENPDSVISAPSAYIDASVSRVGTLGGDDGMGPDRLFQLLEDAVPRPDETVVMNEEQAQGRRELVESTWDQVRRWFWAHESQEERAAAAYIRGQADVTPLHLMCKLNNPPTDIISDIVEAAPEVVSWVDSHGWLPLHHACANGASPDVLQILTNAYPESKLAQDNQNRTPLHFYATRNSDNPSSMAANVTLLSDTGAAEIPDRGGMLPMHYACAYGTSPAVLKVLCDAFPESLLIKENKGRTPMHLAMVNAHRDASPEVLKFLLDNEGANTVNMRDHEENLPLHLLNLGLRGVTMDEPEKISNVSKCIQMYLLAEPVATPDFLAEIQNLPDWLQDVAVISPHVRNVLNKKIVQRFPTSILMLDFTIIMMIIICFEKATTASIELRAFLDCEDAGDPDCREPDGPFPTAALALMYVGASYFLLRELIQVVALMSLGAVTSWFYDTTNWLDMAVISTVFYYSILITLIVKNQDDPGVVDLGINMQSFRAGIATGKAILWLAVIYFLKSISVDFAVFLGGVFYVVQRLVAFLLAVGVILLAFAQMFFIVYTQEAVCQPIEGVDCSFPHCQFQTSLLKVYTMMMGEIGSETRYDGVLVAQILYVAYAFLVVILLSNVLIAIVTDSYEIIQNDRAAVVFWSNRLDFVAEMDGISSVIRRRLCCIGSKKKGAPGAPTKVQEGPNGTTILDTDTSYGVGSKGWFAHAWKSIMLLFESSVYDDADLTPGKIEFWVYVCYQAFALLVVIPIWLVLGVFSVGVLWPPQVREYLFVQKESVVSRAEIERHKLEQLKEIQGDVRALKTEIRKEMNSDRDDLARMKAEIDSVQSEVLSDLQQVKELMSTLLDLGGINLDR